jgi:serine phosphatase RsbU (regulator of sigma subunit)/anti-sigma regulatory factor (Ser/Thr protein kinase)
MRRKRQLDDGETPAATRATAVAGEVVPIPDNDPLLPYLLSVGAPVEVDKVNLSSPAVEAMRKNGVHLIVPLISQGELIGTLSLGRRLSDQPYSTDDRKLLAGLASQVAPAIKVAQLVRQQEAQAKERERIEQELRVASLIQQTLLPKELPRLPGWEVEAYYHSARAVGGDIYDFIPLRDGRIGFVIGDVTDKGVPAALVMATTRTTLRAMAAQTSDPGEVLARTNEALVDEIPPAMFVTCLYGILSPESGELVYANAGHNLPYVRTPTGVAELRATGMPLGLLPGMNYEVCRAQIGAGETVLLSSDGIAESHNHQGEMFGLPRLVELIGDHPGGADLISTILEELDRFRGTAGEQEDDVTMVTIRRTSSAVESALAFGEDPNEVASFSIPSNSGNERIVMERVANVAVGMGIGGEKLDRLKTAVSEAAMNAIEHGNQGDPARLVNVSVLMSADRLLVRISDEGGATAMPEPELPDIDAKLAGIQSPRGWGLFLIEQMVDAVRHSTDGIQHTVELEMSRGAS